MFFSYEAYYTRKYIHVHNIIVAHTPFSGSEVDNRSVRRQVEVSENYVIRLACT